MAQGEKVEHWSAGAGCFLASSPQPVRATSEARPSPRNLRMNDSDGGLLYGSGPAEEQEGARRAALTKSGKPAWKGGLLESESTS